MREKSFYTSIVLLCGDRSTLPGGGLEPIFHNSSVQSVYIINGLFGHIYKTGSVPLSAAANTILAIVIRQESSTAIMNSEKYCY